MERIPRWPDEDPIALVFSWAVPFRWAANTWSVSPSLGKCGRETAKQNRYRRVKQRGRSAAARNGMHARGSARRKIVSAIARRRFHLSVRPLPQPYRQFVVVLAAQRSALRGNRCSAARLVQSRSERMLFRLHNSAGNATMKRQCTEGYYVRKHERIRCILRTRERATSRDKYTRARKLYKL